jgi:uncharacterized membrane protein
MDTDTLITLISRIILSLFFITAGITHFTSTNFYLKIMPSYLPMHKELVYISGILEVISGLLLIIPDTIKIGATGIIIILIAVFPANINMYINYQEFRNFKRSLLLIRLPLQFILIYWAYTFL